MDHPLPYIGSHGYIIDSWLSPEIFYPKQIGGENPLFYIEYYASKFDMVDLSFDHDNPANQKLYEILCKGVESNPRFKFLFRVPICFTCFEHKAKRVESIRKTLRSFWKGIRYVNKQGRLGCVSMDICSDCQCNKKNIDYIKSIISDRPAGVRVALHISNSWWGVKYQRILKKDFFDDGITLALEFLENRFINAGWAGNIRSMRITGPLNIESYIKNSDFVFITLHGTYGNGFGSYDRNDFLERLSQKLLALSAQGTTVFCVFANSMGTYRIPIPPMLPFLCILDKPSPYISKNLPCSLHDLKRMKSILRSLTTTPYTIGPDGYATVVQIE